MNERMSDDALARENTVHASTGGVSAGNCGYGFAPAFLDTETGTVYSSRDAAGRLAPVHRLDGLPEHLIEVRNPAGGVARVKASIISGFLRAGEFFTRSEAAALVEEQAY